MYINLKLMWGLQILKVNNSFIGSLIYYVNWGIYHIVATVELSSKKGHNNYVTEEVRSKYVGLVDLEWGRYS